MEPVLNWKTIGNIILNDPGLVLYTLQQLKSGSKCAATLEARFMAGTDNDPTFNSFRIKLDQLNLFARVLEKSACIWINDENRNRYWHSIPSEFKLFVKVNSFCAASVSVDSKPIGVFYADWHSKDCKIDKQAFILFRHIS